MAMASCVRPELHQEIAVELQAVGVAGVEREGFLSCQRGRRRDDRRSCLNEWRAGEGTPRGLGLLIEEADLGLRDLEAAAAPVRLVQIP